MSKNTKSDTILIVDDQPSNLAIISNHLEKAGYELLLSQEGKMALEQAENENPDLILLDILMPEMNGFDVCSNLKKNDKTRNIPVIFMTALTKTEDKVRGFDLGAVDYITKPFQQAEVLARIKTHLTLKHQKEKIIEQQKKTLETLALKLGSKNKILKIIREEVEKIHREVGEDKIDPLLDLINKNIDIERDWDEFKEEFDDVYEDFRENLSQKFPQLSPYQIKICSMIRGDMMTHEIANLLCIQDRSVESQRYRIRKKLKLNERRNLKEFLKKI